MIESDRELIGEDKTHVKSFDWGKLETSLQLVQCARHQPHDRGGDDQVPGICDGAVVSQSTGAMIYHYADKNAGTLV